MSNRWQVLALLFSVRMVMAFQFQAVAALSPLIMRDFNTDIADIGLLIGLYLSPGIILAYPGGTIGKRFGDKPAVLIGLVLMICGGILVALSSDWTVQIGGRLVAGVGGVILNVVMSKMVTDWFAGREIATAMGMFVNSWPVGIALALVVLPPIAEASSLMTAHLFVAGLAMAGLILIAALYRSPTMAEGTITEKQPGLQGAILAAVIISGLIWGLYNSALAMIFGFGPAMLAERGWSNSEASSATSIALWVVAISVPLGGVIADRTGQRNIVLVSGLILFAVALVIATRTDAVLWMFVILGIVGGISAGPIMSLPAAVLRIENRGAGMGVFFALYYLVAVLTPMIGGHLASLFGSASVTFDFGAAMLVACCLALFLFDRLANFALSRPVAAPEKI